VVLKDETFITAKGEIHEVSEAITDVINLYDIPITKETVAWTRLVIVLSTTYGKRILVGKPSQARAPQAQKSPPVQSAPVGGDSNTPQPIHNDLLEASLIPGVFTGA
jgi:hypothetical protein